MPAAEPQCIAAPDPVREARFACHPASFAANLQGAGEGVGWSAIDELLPPRMTIFLGGPSLPQLTSGSFSVTWPAGYWIAATLWAGPADT